MFAWIAAVLFAIATLISGGDLQPATAWLHPITVISAGLLCLALHAGFGSGWPKRG